MSCKISKLKNTETHSLSFKSNKNDNVDIIKRQYKRKYISNISKNNISNSNK